MERPCAKLGSDKPTVEHDIEVILNEPLKLSFGLKRTMAHQRCTIIRTAEKRHVHCSLRRVGEPAGIEPTRECSFNDW
jgi:hypothetical protein